MRWKCSNCGSYYFEEVASCEYVSSVVQEVNEQDELEYESPLLLGDVHILRYQCCDCGYALAKDGTLVPPEEWDNVNLIDSPEELIEVLEELDAI